MNELDLQKFNQAIQFAQKGQNATARYILAELAHQYPQEANIWLWLAFSSADREHAQQSLEKVAQLDPANPNLGQAAAWVEQQFPAATTPTSADTGKSAKVKPADEPPESKNSRSKFPLTIVGLILVSIAGLIAVFVIFTSAVNGFAAGSNSAMFNSELPTPGAQLATRININDETAGKLEEEEFAGKSQEAIAKAKTIKRGYFVIKTLNIPQVMAYYQNYVRKTAFAPSYSAATNVYWCEKVKDTQEYLGVNVALYSSKAEFKQFMSTLKVSLQPDESILFVGVSKTEMCGGTTVVVS